MTGVRTGIDRVLSGDVTLPRNARLGLLSNYAARSSRGRWVGGALNDCGYRVNALLTPEHGLAASANAGQAVPHSSAGGVPILSMYGADRAPLEDALSSLDILVVDLPDVGCRYYTYNWTLKEALMLAARHTVRVMVLDRPNPLGGLAVEGNLPDRTDSPVCAAAVPIRHSLTFGELAYLHRGALGLDVDLHVVPVEGWRRGMLWDETCLSWTPPSPALTTPKSTLAYPGTCLLEGTNISEGRGTDHPFLLCGAPFLDASSLATTLRANPFLMGARVHPVTFTPASSKWALTRCEGVRIEIENRTAFRPVRAGLALVAALAQTDGFAFRPTHFDALAGTSAWRTQIEDGRSAEEISHGWNADEHRFQEARDVVIPPAVRYYS